MCVTPMSSPRAIVRERLRSVACRHTTWQSCARVSCMFRCLLSEEWAPGPIVAVSTPWCRRSAALPIARGNVPGRRPGPQFYPVSAIDYLTGYLMAFGAMVALARRTREGGSWLVRASLAQTGRWLVDRGEVPESQLRDVPGNSPPKKS